VVNVVALAGGVGGAKLADGLAEVLPAEQLTIVVNTGDDFEHLGLTICPDLDTVCYTLAGMANADTGWGRHDETLNVFDNLVKLNGPGWFHLGDKDLGTHLARSHLLRSGVGLSEITRRFSGAWGIHAKVLPMSDDPIQTRVISDEGELTFQDYFVRLQCRPIVRGFRFEGVERSQPAPGVLEAIRMADLVVICPSNPMVSIDPILAVPGVKVALHEKPVLAVSPIIGGKAVKGPAAKMYVELGIQPSVLAVARHYGCASNYGLLNSFVIDDVDKDLRGEITDQGCKILVTQTLMKTRSDRRTLAQNLLSFAESL
jgi:LPPG:FO 2-phospho-L-lactate transferase